MKKIIAVSAALGMMGFATSSYSATVSYTMTGNDCSGFFGKGEACVISYDGEEISPIIAKVGYDDNGDIDILDDDSQDIETNSAFPSVDGSEFDVSFDGGAGNSGSGSWSYTPTGNDPAVRFWVAKGSTEFTLFWDVADVELEIGGVCADSVFNLACLDAAEEVTSGTWSTSGSNLSHITYYDTGVVPVPAAAWLFGSGLIGLVGVARRKKA